jgi:hypothetical protein
MEECGFAPGCTAPHFLRQNTIAMLALFFALAGTTLAVANARATAGFFKTSKNIVYLKGSITGGSGGTVAFTLPVGYRPASTLLLPAASGSNLIVVITINSSGQLSGYCNATCTGSIGIDGLSFRVGSGGAAPSPGRPTGDSPDG